MLRASYFRVKCFSLDIGVIEGLRFSALYHDAYKG